MEKIIKKTNHLGRSILLCAVCGMLTCCGTQNSTQTSTSTIGMPNPWTDCGKDLNLAAQKAGFSFPLSLSDYTVRAMNDMIEITYPLDEHRTISVRKSSTEINSGDISGDSNSYPLIDKALIHNCVPITLKRDNNRIYVMYFGAESGYFSARCEQGMSLKEVEAIYEIIAAAEAPKPWMNE